jgi:hypothetical protein
MLYTALKEKLLSAHELMSFKRTDKLLQMEPLGSRKPMNFLQTFWRYVPQVRRRICCSCFFSSIVFPESYAYCRARITRCRRDSWRLRPIGFGPSLPTSTAQWLKITTILLRSSLVFKQSQSWWLQRARPAAPAWRGQQLQHGAASSSSTARRPQAGAGAASRLHY